MEARALVGVHFVKVVDGHVGGARLGVDAAESAAQPADVGVEGAQELLCLRRLVGCRS